MFSIFLAWIGFIGTSILFVAIALHILFKSEATKLYEDLNAIVTGERITFINWKTLTMAVVWVVSGTYLFG